MDRRVGQHPGTIDFTDKQAIVSFPPVCDNSGGWKKSKVLYAGKSPSDIDKEIVSVVGGHFNNCGLEDSYAVGDLSDILPYAMRIARLQPDRASASTLTN